MRSSALFVFGALLISVSFSVAMAQGAATGGTKDVGSPSMVYPIRPREEPVGSTAVPNAPQPPPHVARLRRNYYYRLRR
jgi:hypothetical protein